MPADNSVIAYQAAFRTHRLDTLRWRVYQTVRESPGLTDDELADVLHTTINCITGRVLELRRAGLLVCNEDARNKRDNRARRNYPAVVGPLDGFLGASS